MSRCIRCKKHYREPADEQGDHDCPHCGLRPEERERWFREPDEESEEPNE